MTDRISLSGRELQLQRRHALASTIATAIEWYDFLLYSTITRLMFANSVTGQHRSNGASLGCRPAAGPAPLIATWLFRTFQSTTAIIVYIASCAAATFVANGALSRICRRSHFGRTSNAEIARADVICAALTVPL